VPQVGRVAIRSWIDQQPKDFAVEVQTYSHELVVTGDWAFDRGAYMVYSAPKTPSSPALENGNYIRLWRRDGETWTVARDIWNQMPHLQLSDQLKLEPKTP
jgi:hypothetical protein